MTESSEINKYGKNVSYSIVGNIITTILLFIQIPILTRGLGATYYGTWSLINITVSLLSPLAMLGFNSSLIRFLAAEKSTEKLSEDFFSACIIVAICAFVISAILFLLSGLLAKTIFGGTNSILVVKLTSILIILDSLYTTFIMYFIMKKNILLLTIFNVSYAIFQTGLIIFFLALGQKLTGVVIGWIIDLLGTSMIALLIILGQLKFHRPRFTNIRSYLKYGLPLMGIPAILWIIYASDRYLISYFLGDSATGIYSAAYGVGGYADFMLAAVCNVLFPTISKLFDEGNLEKTKSYMKYTLKFLIMLIIPSAAGLSVLATQLLKIITTQAFIAGSVVVPFIAFSSVFNCFYQICIFVMLLYHKTQINFWLLLIAAFLNILLNLILIPSMGIVGSALASLTAFGVLGTMTFFVSRRYFKFDIGAIFILKSFISAALMMLCIWLIKPESLMGLAISIIIGIVAYFAILGLMKGFSRQEINYLISFMKNQFKRTGHLDE
jgi:O-antigen/teichoic acid export membrane protein